MRMTGTEELEEKIGYQIETNKKIEDIYERNNQNLNDEFNFILRCLRLDPDKPITKEKFANYCDKLFENKEK